MDFLCAIINNVCAGLRNVFYLCRTPHGRVVDHGQHQHHCNNFEHACAWYDAYENAAVCLDLAYNGLSVNRGDACPRWGRDYDAVRHSLRYEFLQRSGRWGSGDVPAHLLVLWTPRSLHHDIAGFWHRFAHYSDLCAKTVIWLRIDGLRGGFDRVSVVYRLGAPYVYRWNATCRAIILHVFHHADRHPDWGKSVQLDRNHVARIYDV